MERLDLIKLRYNDKVTSEMIHSLVHGCLVSVVVSEEVSESFYEIKDIDGSKTIIYSNGTIHATHKDKNGEIHNSHISQLRKIQKLLEPFWIEEDEKEDGYDVEKRMIPLGQLRREMEEAINRVDKLEEIVMGYQEYPEPEIDLSDGWFNDIERFINSVKVMGTINVCSYGNALKRAISYFTELLDIKQKMREKK